MNYDHTQLGKKTSYQQNYNADLLFPIARADNRQTLGIKGALPFQGVDIWHGYELSWLEPNGKPQIALAQFIFPCESICLIESKSFKLYLNSFNQTHFPSATAVREILIRDLSAAARAPVSVELTMPHSFANTAYQEFSGSCLDELKVDIQHYHPHPDLLFCHPNIVTETVYSNLLKSNCPVTGQPDWASVWINYTGPQIDRASLLAYIISYRNCDDFHEQCVERIFMDLRERCQTTALSVYARYTRRGGLDINPYRSTLNSHPTHLARLARQ